VIDVPFPSIGLLYSVALAPGAVTVKYRLELQRSSCTSSFCPIVTPVAYWTLSYPLTCSVKVVPEVPLAKRTVSWRMVSATVGLPSSIVAATSLVIGRLIMSFLSVRPKGSSAHESVRHCMS